MNITNELEKVVSYCREHLFKDNCNITIDNYNNGTMHHLVFTYQNLIPYKITVAIDPVMLKEMMSVDNTGRIFATYLKRVVQNEILKLYFKEERSTYDN